MALKEIIDEIRKLSPAEQYRLKEFFTKSLASYSASEPVFKEVSEREHKDVYTCPHCHSNNAVRFGKTMLKWVPKHLNANGISVRIVERRLQI
jgi:Zn finger protein HypA/HybF involved in hydrogenase expression